MDEQFFGAQPGIPPYVEAPGDVRPDLSEKVGGVDGLRADRPDACPSCSRTRR